MWPVGSPAVAVLAQVVIQISAEGVQNLPREPRPLPALIHMKLT